MRKCGQLASTGIVIVLYSESKRIKGGGIRKVNGMWGGTDGSGPVCIPLTWFGEEGCALVIGIHCSGFRPKFQ